MLVKDTVVYDLFLFVIVESQLFDSVQLHGLICCYHFCFFCAETM